VGNGCWVAASEGVVVGLGESGAFAGGVGLVDSPGNGNCSAGEDFFAAGVHGLAVWSGACVGVWPGARQGVAGGLCGVV
jgi:hypothetical protein